MNAVTSPEKGHRRDDSCSVPNVVMEAVCSERVAGMNTNVKGIGLVCPYCESHPAVVEDASSLVCPRCGRRYSEWNGKPCFLADDVGTVDSWREGYSKAVSAGSFKKALITLAQKLRAPKVKLRRLPHLDLLEALGKRGAFKALYIGHNQQFEDKLSRDIIQLNVVPLEYVDIVSMGEYVPFPDDSFDLVVMSQVIEHTQYPFKVVEECYRLLKPGGKLYVSTPWVYPFHGGDNYRFSNEGLRFLCYQFDDIKVGSLNGPFHALAVFLAYFVGEGLSFGNRYIRYLVGIVVSWLVFPLVVIDALTNRRRKKTYVLDANIYAIATKKGNEAPM